MEQQKFKPAFPPCRDRMAAQLEKEGYECIEMYTQHGQRCWVYQRDPWDAEVVIRLGEYNPKFGDYCQTGDVAA